MTSPDDPQRTAGDALGPEYDAFVSDAARALEPSAADAARVRARLDAALSGASAPAEIPVSAAGASAPWWRGVTVRWVGLAVVTFAVLGVALVSTTGDDSHPPDSAPEAPHATSAATGVGPRGAASASDPDGRADVPRAAEAGSAAGADNSAAAAPGAPAPPFAPVAPAAPAAAHGAAGGSSAQAAQVPTGASASNVGAPARAARRPTAAGSPQPSHEGGAQANAPATPATTHGTAGTTPDSTETGNPPSAGRAEAPEAPRESLLAREAARLLRARNALSAGRPSEALTLTTRLPEGDPLSPERRAIRVRALCALGRTAAARQTAGTLGAGNGPSAAAVRASCVGDVGAAP